MKRKFFAAVLSSVMAITLLAGCGSGSTESAETPSAGESAKENVEVTDASADSGEIYMFISSPEYADAINTLIEEYKNVAPGVTINYETTQNDYPTMLKAKLNSGEVPDIFSSQRRPGRCQRMTGDCQGLFHSPSILCNYTSNTDRIYR